MSFCQSSEFRANLQQMIMGSRVVTERITVSSNDGCLPELFHRKKTVLIFDLATH